MPAERGSFLFNVVVGFSLLVAGLFAAGFITEDLFPQDQTRVYAFILVVCVFPFFLFLRWARPTGDPLWKDSLPLIVLVLGRLIIEVAMPSYGIEGRWWRYGMAFVGVTALSTAWYLWWRRKARRLADNVRNHDQNATG